MKDLTERQKEVLVTIASLTDTKGWPPTIRELGQALGIANPNGVKRHLEALKRKGFVGWVPGKYRTLEITKTIPASLESWEEEGLGI